MTWQPRLRPRQQLMGSLETLEGGSSQKNLQLQTTAFLAAVVAAVILRKAWRMVDDSWSYWMESDCELVHLSDSWP